MNVTAPFFFRPGQHVKPFDVYRKGTTIDEMGRPVFSAGPEKLETIYGTISRASQHEQFQWNQNGHPISHTIVCRGRIRADAADEVRTEGRVWTVQGKHDPAELGYFSTLYCLEKLGVSKT